MKKFMDENFLLKNDSAVRLYHEYAKAMPIFDYHCHLIPKEIADNKREPSITSAWLYGDHYKWRQMRSNGYDEKQGDDFERFLHYADTIAHAIGNPIYHWSHLELQRFFGIDTPLSPKTAREIYDEANRKLKEDPDLDAYGIFKKFNVYAVGTTDDPADTLEYHEAIRKAAKTKTKVIPSYRPDKAMNIDAEGFNAYIDKLAKSSGVSITSASDVMTALSKRLDFFIQNGCLATDHAIIVPPYAPASDAKVNEVFLKARAGKSVTSEEAEIYRTYILMSLAEQYAKKGIVMQLHMQSSRNNNSRGFKALGPDTGYDGVTDNEMAYKLSRFMDTLDSKDALPKTIIYTLNPKDYYPIGTLMGCFQRDIPGKIQMGSAWWFCDHIDGMTEQMKVLGNLGLLSRFVGMLTDSRSFLSYPRHEYFRRILCNMLGTWMEDGEIPADYDLVGTMVQDISFNNAKRYFEGK
ncbi:MAG: glucuronate isomerase [Spirochaetales bacterium]|nr:glucuronate isomerase [Spirochaetales bacterium]MBO7348498.1 glucuronate isomerase [Spirochaetales bacterium]MBP5756729.1 glucuronate isomerase [Spirochaetales bacterium]